MNTCHACALQGFTTPATHTVDVLTLCTPCLRDAHTFAGFSAWSFETKLARINALLDLDFPTTRRDEDFAAQLDTVGF